LEAVQPVRLDTLANVLVSSGEYLRSEEALTCHGRRTADFKILSSAIRRNTFFNGFLSRHSSPPLFADSFQKNVSAARDHFLLRGFLAFDLAFGGFLSFLLSVSDSLCAIVTAGCAAVPEPSLSGVLRSHLFQAKGNESSGDCTRTGLGLESALKVLR
jgi:hypothetical protein